tara:strand:- start:23537 stop:24232 length:696 start_codon:yes stop_codon:yes gene_type:complete
MTAPLLLNQNVHYCAIGHAYVVLDLVHDRYAFLPPNQAKWMRAIETEMHPAALSDKTVLFADRLVSRGILTRQQGEGRPIAASTAARPLSSSAADVNPDQTRLTVPHVAFFLLALMSAWRLHTSGSLLKTVQAARRWKAQAGSAGFASAEQARALVAVADRLSPLFYTREDACRFRSLLLIRYLSFFGVKADWVFGVRLSPFGAHCWVALDREVLTDPLDTVLEYTPILIV